jgi:hypothetical protein
MAATQTLNEALTEASRTAKELREQLAVAESDLALAIEDKRYADAEQHKAAADALRQPVLIAEAHVTALMAGQDELRRHREEEQRATQLRVAREQATVQFQAATEREADATEEVQRLMAEVPVALAALQDCMRSALDAQRRIHMARNDAHTAGIAAGVWAPDMPLPAAPNMASSRFETDPLWIAVMRAGRRVSA